MLHDHKFKIRFDQFKIGDLFVSKYMEILKVSELRQVPHDHGIATVVELHSVSNPTHQLVFASDNETDIELSGIVGRCF